MSLKLKPTLEFIESIAIQAGDILQNLADTDLQIRHKSRKDLVTKADYESERFLLDAVLNKYPAHSIIAEESGKRAGDADHQWFIDPLDGTINYARGLPVYAVSIGYAYQGKMALGVVYDPSRKELFSARRGGGATLNGQAIQVANQAELIDCMIVSGFPYSVENLGDEKWVKYKLLSKKTQAIRRIGSAALSSVYVAAGRLDGIWDISFYPWDMAAAAVILEEAGAVVTDIYGGQNYLTDPTSLVSANPVIHKQLLEILQESPKK